MKSIRFSLFFIFLSLMASSCSGPKTYRSAEGAVWNTTFHITYRADRDLRDSVLAVMKEVEMSLSPFADASLISQINRGEDAVADSLLRRIFTASQSVNRVSRGAFDPTVAPLVNLWGFGYRPGDPEPTQAEIDSLLMSVGIAGCVLGDDGRITRKHPSTEFNFSAITKGYGCDLVGEMLRRNGCTDYMVEIGGEIALSGMNPRGEEWRIMVDAPVDGDSAVVHEKLAIVSLTGCGVATSGNYRNYRETGQGRAWHTISPVSGRPALTDLLSATVIAPDCMMADALATSCMAMPSDSAMAMIEGLPGTEALLVTADTVLTTSGFPEIR